MFNFDAKTIIIGGAVILAAATVATAVYLWSTEKEWSAEAVEETKEALLKAHNDAITEHPADWQKAAFLFETSAATIREAFKSQYGSFDEYAEWEKAFNAKITAMKMAMRKS